MSYYESGTVHGYGENDGNAKYSVGQFRCDEDFTGQKGIFAIKAASNFTEGEYRFAVFSTDGHQAITYDGQTPIESFCSGSNFTTQLNSKLEYREKIDKDEYKEPTDQYSNATYRFFRGLYWGLYREITYCDFPIYDFSDSKYPTQDQIAGLNKYITEGDDSEASNYHDLHPSRVQFDIWADGTFPSLYIKPSMESGEYDGETLGVTIYSNPVLHPELTYSNYNLAIDTMGYISYQEYENANPIVYTRYSISCHTGDSPMNTCEGFIEINSNGTVRETTNGSTNEIVVIFHEGMPSDNDYPESSNVWNTDPTTNEFSGANTLTQTYEITEPNLQALGNFMWSSTFKDNIFALVNSPIENIVSLKAMPVHGEGITEKEIKIGNVSTGIRGDLVPYADGIKKTINKNGKAVVIPGTFDNFIDYSEYDIQVYLPFIGFKSLDPILYVNRQVMLYYIYDTIYGNVLAVLYVYDSKGNPLIHDTFQGNCGIDIAITSTNRGQIENGYINAGINAISDLAKGNVAGFASDVFGGLTQEFHSQSNGVGNPSLLNKLDMTAKFIVKKPVMFKPNEYGHIVGYPCYQYKALSEVGGSSSDATPYNKFVKCKDFVCSRIYGALDEEKREIEKLMSEGVYM